MTSLFYDGPEYIERMNTPFSPTKVTLAQVHSAIPKHLHEKSTIKSVGYASRDIICAVIVYKLGWKIDTCAKSLVADYNYSSLVGWLVKWGLWQAYWYWQGIVLAGWWVMGHEAGHGSLSNHAWINHIVGFPFHTFLLSPYFAWRSSHRAHHKATNSIEREETYVPRTRKDYNLPPEPTANVSDYHDIFEDTPAYTLARMLIMQAFGLQCYLLTNAMGSPMYPAGTNHFRPSSPLFKNHERPEIIASNIGLVVMASILYFWTQEVGYANFFKLYFVPYILTNHWVVMITYLQHTDPTIPHFRDKQWSFLQGAISTVDRPLLGWIGRFFLHNVLHDHVAHHLFSSIPFYNQPQVTRVIKMVLKSNYNYDSTNTFRALYRSFTQCCFVEDDGDIVFYKNKDGRVCRLIAPEVHSHTGEI